MGTPPIVTRFAPSPTGDLHLGGALVALASYWMAKRQGGTFVLRVEDIDTPRVIDSSREAIEEDLRWLGLTWDRTVIQSEEHRGHLAAFEALGPYLYPCDCSRKEIASVASAPHEGEEVVYPGTCFPRPRDREFRKPPAFRIRVPDQTVAIYDELKGDYVQNLRRDVGDFVLRRNDDVFSYQLVVTVDDLANGITDIVRGDDLLPSTPRQAWLASLLGQPYPRTWHLPMMRDSEGQKLSKRSALSSVRDLRSHGVSGSRVLGFLAYGLGLSDNPLEETDLPTLLRSPQDRMVPQALTLPTAW
ncbi:MAG: tRNA glutamyl-Q(34) synthetase GluQRS [Polyangiaceae bacterium]|nr:tRNA glutamyl-Q(34) synthetase GluQRS [Polyangiaceae bacterium]